MNAFTIAWVLWVLAFLAIEGIAILVKDKPGHPATLSAHVWWLARGAGPWHTALRLLLAAFLGWLTHHLLS